MLSRWQEVLAFGAALGLHAAAFTVLRSSVDARVAPAARTPTRVAELDFDFELAEPDLGRAHDVRSEQGDQRLARFVAPRSVRAEELGGAVPGSEGSVEAAEVTLEESPEVETTTKPIDLGIGPDGWQRWAQPLKPGERPPEQRQQARTNRFQVFRAPPVSTSGGLHEGLEASDRARGLGPSGRVLSALHAAAHTTVAPEVGKARFDVTVLRTGAVEVTLGAVSGDVEKWRRVGAHLAADLRAAPPKIAPPREGAKFVVELVAEETMPNGTKAKSFKRRHVEAAPLKLESTETSKKKLDADNPTMKEPSRDFAPTKLDTPGVYVAETNEVCSYLAGAGVLGHGPQLPLTFGPVLDGACDPSSLGATRQRMVRARVIDQTMF